MATSLPIYCATPCIEIREQGKWKQLASEGRIVAAMADFMAINRDFDQSKAEAAVFRHIRSMSKRKNNDGRD